MTPERMAALVAPWARCYTRNLPPPVAHRRVEEITSDLFDHITSERARGTSGNRIAWSLASRMIRGLLADALWRRRQVAAVHAAIGRRIAPIGVPGWTRRSTPRRREKLERCRRRTDVRPIARDGQHSDAAGWKSSTQLPLRSSAGWVHRPARPRLSASKGYGRRSRVW